MTREEIIKAVATGKNLTGADLRGANLYGAGLYGARLRGAYLRGADLSRADLRRANLYGADLTGTYLHGANLHGAGLYGAVIGKHILVRLAGRATRFDGYEFFAFKTKDGNVICAGCRTFTLAEFRAHVKAEYPNTDKARRTLRLLSYLAAELKEKP